MDNKFRFLYWDDLGDSHSHVDNQKKSGGSRKIKESEQDLLGDRIFDAEWAEKEQELNSRMDVIGQNGNNGEHYEDTEEDVN